MEPEQKASEERKQYICKNTNVKINQRMTDQHTCNNVRETHVTFDRFSWSFGVSFRGIPVEKQKGDKPYRSVAINRYFSLKP